MSESDLSIPNELARSPVALRRSVMSARFGRCDVRFGPPGRLLEFAPAARGCGLASVLGGVVVGELALSVLGEHPKDAQV